MTSVFDRPPPFLLPLFAESVLLWKGENESFLREHEKKVNRGKARAEARAWPISQAWFLQPKIY